eukprot:TRINITY_DN1319_c1_g2_i1.p1 TRINITY_DN1319_c1_g2~~TRINITY_DN1319_c1_g2_i1.p1  ORF type:complete len:417 (-),score=46.37 TRINITY_DN1319_c1_g2_i1:98-1231(-)
MCGMTAVVFCSVYDVRSTAAPLRTLTFRDPVLSLEPASSSKALLAATASELRIFDSSFDVLSSIDFSGPVRGVSVSLASRSMFISRGDEPAAVLSMANGQVRPWLCTSSVASSRSGQSVVFRTPNHYMYFGRKIGNGLWSTRDMLDTLERDDLKDLHKAYGTKGSRDLRKDQLVDDLAKNLAAAASTTTDRDTSTRQQLRDALAAANMSTHGHKADLSKRLCDMQIGDGVSRSSASAAPSSSASAASVAGACATPGRVTRASAKTPQAPSAPQPQATPVRSQRPLRAAATPHQTLLELSPSHQRRRLLRSRSHRRRSSGQPSCSTSLRLWYASGRPTTTSSTWRPCRRPARHHRHRPPQHRQRLRAPSGTLACPGFH